MLPTLLNVLHRHLQRAVLGTLALLLGVASLLAVPSVAQAGVKSVTVAPGATRSVTDGRAFIDGFGRASFVVPSTKVRPITVAVQFRGTSLSSGYRSSVLISADGRLRLRIFRIKGGTATSLRETALPTKVTAGQRLNIQGWVHGTSSVLIRTRTWVEGKAKPGWQLSHTDRSSTRLRTSAVTRAVVYLGSKAKSRATFKLTMSLDPEANSPSAPAPTKPSPAPAPAPVSGASISTPGKRLNASQVGVPAGTSLKKHYGDLTITKAGTVVDRMDIHGVVYVKARNVRITKSIIRGGPAKWKVGMITAKGQPGLVVEDSDIVAAKPSVRMDGVLGDNFTLRRVHIQGGVDNVQIQGDNVRIESSLLEKMNYYAHDPSQNNGPSHNDSIQVLAGRNIVVIGTTALAGNLNFALLGGAAWGHITLRATNNYFDGGHCNVKLETLNGQSQSATVANNTFGPNVKVKSCPLVATRGVKLTASGNVAAVGGRAIVPLRI